MAKFKFTPSPGYIFVKPIDDDDDNNYIRFINKGGSSDDSNKLMRGKVIAVPHLEKTTLRGNKDMPISSEQVMVKIGDTVLYAGYSCYTVEINDEEYHLIDNWSIKARL
jgi:co-chaperonin GroES (HSP10)